VVKRRRVLDVNVEHRLHHCTTTIEQVRFQKSSAGFCAFRGDSGI
jgi:hypothetical protein